MRGCRLRGCWFEPTFHKHAGKLCTGLQIHVDDGAYELARTWTEYGVTGICQKDYVYFERGTPAFAQLFDLAPDLVRHHGFLVADDIGRYATAGP